MEVHLAIELQAMLDVDLEGPAIYVHVFSISAAPTHQWSRNGHVCGWICSPLVRLSDLALLAFDLWRTNYVATCLLKDCDDKEPLPLQKESMWPRGWFVA